MRAGSEEAVDYGLWWHETLEFFPWAGGEAAFAAHGERRLAAAEATGFGARARVEWAAWLESDARRELERPRWARQAELAIFAPLGADAWMDGVMDLVLHDAQARETWVLDWKTNRRRAGEEEAVFLARLADEYAPQLRAYGRSLALMFPGTNVRRLLYATGVGRWIEISADETDPI